MAEVQGGCKDCLNLKKKKCIAAQKPARKTRAEMMKEIDADYYGYRDEDDGIIVPQELELEKKGKIL